jgi:hypothetical protein
VEIYHIPAHIISVSSHTKYTSTVTKNTQRKTFRSDLQNLDSSFLPTSYIKRKVIPLQAYGVLRVLGSLGLPDSVTTALESGRLSLPPGVSF